ncbi:TAXI family TRAP transporter solute-binding subunit [Marinobacter daepoensis]|uniref:TAXI family TRAP transporter solute-binding subunit n=1 Tax=Marinobacter daepoensis TaxID=262077 RepID=UPI001C94C9A3|nr:TAXI family TRAP transporter solute-binding subunit [Marinobacter daepoensis]MBY6032935.1 TAXI family TRAP transporter solute-binding subunit [Marinobacter daepoensis]
MKVLKILTASAALALFSPLAMASDRSEWPSSLTLGTASQGGTYYIYGSSWANMVNQKLSLQIGAEISGGPVQNIAMVQAGSYDFGLVTTGPARQALKGQNPLLPGEKHEDVRVMFPMYQTALNIIALKKSGIGSVEDLEGRAVGVGPAGGTNQQYFPKLFELVGVDVTPREGGGGDQAGQVQDGLLDALAFGAGIPIAAFSQLEAQTEVNIFSFSPEQVDSIIDTYPEFSRSEIPAGAYASVPDGFPTVALWNFAITHKDMPESLVYEIVKTVMENNEELRGAHSSAAETLPENVKHNKMIPFHPGAVRWFEENGYDIPDHLEG